MAPRAGAPLRKITLNLFHDDVIKLQHGLGEGYSVWIRDLIHEKLKNEPTPQVKHKPKPKYEPFLIEDLDDDLP